MVSASYRGWFRCSSDYLTRDVSLRGIGKIGACRLCHKASPTYCIRPEDRRTRHPLLGKPKINLEAWGEPPIRLYDQSLQTMQGQNGLVSLLLDAPRLCWTRWLLWTWVWMLCKNSKTLWTAEGPLYQFLSMLCSGAGTAHGQAWQAKWHGWFPIWCGQEWFALLGTNLSGLYLGVKLLDWNGFLITRLKNMGMARCEFLGSSCISIFRNYSCDGYFP